MAVCAKCGGQWHCCDDHPIGKPWGWNSQAWSEHYTTCPKYRDPSPSTGATTSPAEGTVT